MNASAEYLQVQRLSDEELVRVHTPLVHRIAYHLMARLPPSVDVHDLIQSGMIGLLEAAKNFTPGRAASFETFAGIRIRGAMLDELRKSDWTPRSVHRKVRELTEATRQVEYESGGDADTSEVMRRMGIDSNEYNQILADAATSRVLSLSGSENEDGAAMDVADTASLGPAEGLEDGGMREALAEAIEQLPEREKLVMSLYYDEELNLKEIGAVLGVSESRVCQIHGQAVVRLRARMHGWCDNE
ncbi:MAG: RNA polymerase sigma factor FliA [Xanthomonadales bacterium]|nr:RNA polymerase sigma factor FliA [Xanthomonadales bacterium]ODU95297.1 MAG: RNA polymerase sigma factor FliA [Rhodanobacter sp. SCN 66-43]OJY83023.1 MAG: RNA polymerase sigma factor FliA [Xanthomonadales bacterium 66-474]